VFAVPDLNGPKIHFDACGYKARLSAHAASSPSAPSTTKYQAKRLGLPAAEATAWLNRLIEVVRTRKNRTAVSLTEMSRVPFSQPEKTRGRTENAM
jgi:hypothetical protein